MKKQAFLFFVLFIIVNQMMAQIEVGYNNNVGIGISGPVNSKLSINTTGSSSWMGYILGVNGSSGLVVKRGPLATSGSWGYALYGIATEINGLNMAIYGNAYNSSTTYSGRSYGVFGVGGNADNGRNYGVYGKISGSRNGAGIFGTQYADAVINGIYAGYFYGHVKITGDLDVDGTFESSDRNLKQEIKDLEKNNLSKIKQVHAIKFKYKIPEELSMSDSANTTLSPQTKEYYDRERIGFIAQEIQQVYPELVKVDQQGFLAVNYSGLIPILLEAIKEQQVTIETLIEEVDKLKIKSKK
ncbi:MAG: tail fiber domain-containing protein [Salinivirgaceae bacterium]